MPDYFFQGPLYRGKRNMLDAIAYEWLTAGGANHADDVADALASYTDLALAFETIMARWLGTGDGDDVPTHMKRNGYTLADLAAAFARFRAARPDTTPTDENPE